MTIAEAKQRLRAEVRAARARRKGDGSAGDRAADEQALAAHALRLLDPGPARVTAYLSLPTEPGTDALLNALRSAGHMAWVPRVAGSGTGIAGSDLEWVSMAEDPDLQPGPMGIREPRGPAHDATVLASMDVMFLPGLAVDCSGHRLGQGGGYYDRALEGVPTHTEGGPLRVVVLFDDEMLDEVPFEPHDCVMDAALRPSGVTYLPLTEIRP